VTNYANDTVTEGGTVAANQRSGTASSDAVPAGCLLLLNNTGAGSHNVDLTINALWHGMSPGSAATPGKRRIVISAAQWLAVRVPVEFGDANGLVAVTIDGTAAEVKYFCLGA